MTAEELAVKMEMGNHDWADDAAEMLRQQQAELDAFKLNYYNTGYSLQLRDKDETIKQQQAEIEALKKELALQRLSDISQEIENEPVAWMTENGTIFDELPPISGGLIPLYTHPNEDRDSAIHATGYWKGVEYKRMRELTDEEIVSCIDESEPNATDMIRFARAILKKASEK